MLTHVENSVRTSFRRRERHIAVSAVVWWSMLLRTHARCSIKRSNKPVFVGRQLGQLHVRDVAECEEDRLEIVRVQLLVNIRHVDAVIVTRLGAHLRRFMKETVFHLPAR